MTYDLSDKLVVGVASSALFDLTESDAFFQANGEAAYRAYQDDRVADTLAPGVAFPFIQRLLGLNDLRAEESLVEVIVLSRNDPMTGLRVMRSIEAHNLDMIRAVFTQGAAPYRYMKALNMSLFLSGNRDDVDAAVAAGFPAGHVLASQASYDKGDHALRVAFDFDGVLAADQSETIFAAEGIESFRKHEATNVDEALPPGPLKPLLEKLNVIQRLEEARHLEDPDYRPRVRIALVTARSAPAHERAMRSLQQWGVAVNDAFFLGGIEKAKVLEVLRPHVFFDDQTVHLDGAAASVSSVHIPYGVKNRAPR